MVLLIHSAQKCFQLQEDKDIGIFSKIDKPLDFNETLVNKMVVFLM